MSDVMLGITGRPTPETGGTGSVVNTELSDTSVLDTAVGTINVVVAEGGPISSPVLSSNLC